MNPPHQLFSCTGGACACHRVFPLILLNLFLYFLEFFNFPLDVMPVDQKVLRENSHWKMLFSYKCVGL